VRCEIIRRFSSATIAMMPTVSRFGVGHVRCDEVHARLLQAEQLPRLRPLRHHVDPKSGH
jgi:hypothetical protein